MSTKMYSKASGYIDTHSIFYAGVDVFIFIFFIDFFIFSILELVKLIVNTIIFVCLIIYTRYI